MNFDVIVGNPPYDRSLHLKIISTIIPYMSEDGVGCFIHPARWLQDPLAEFKKNSAKKKFSNIVERLDGVKFIDNETAISKFKISINGELMISTIKKNPTGKKISPYSDIANECVKVILGYSKDHNLEQVDEKDKIDGWRCQINDIIPISDVNQMKSNTEYLRKKPANIFAMNAKNVFYDGMDENGLYWTETRSKSGTSHKIGEPFPHSIKFPDEQTALNFQASCNTNFYNNIMYLLKLDMHTPLSFLPWMEDYTHPWTDEDYCKFFGKLGMSEECQKWMCRDVYDYRVKDFIDYEKFDDEKSKESKSEPVKTPEPTKKVYSDEEDDTDV